MPVARYTYNPPFLPKPMYTSPTLTRPNHPHYRLIDRAAPQTSSPPPSAVPVPKAARRRPRNERTRAHYELRATLFSVLRASDITQAVAAAGLDDPPSSVNLGSDNSSSCGPTRIRARARVDIMCRGGTRYGRCVICTA